MRKCLGTGSSFRLIMIGGALAWLDTPDKGVWCWTKKDADPPSVFLYVAGRRLHVPETGPRAAPFIQLLRRSSVRAYIPGRIGLATSTGIIASFATIFLALG